MIAAMHACAGPPLPTYLHMVQVYGPEWLGLGVKQWVKLHMVL